MGRPKNKPEFDSEKILDEVLHAVLEEYENLEAVQRVGGELSYGALKELADELGFKPSKVKKLLITAGVKYNKDIYVNKTGKEVLKMLRDGKTTPEIMEMTGLKRSSVFGYLPYSKAVYKASELSTDAERIRLFRNRKNRSKNFMSDITAKSRVEAEEYLWNTLEYLQGCIFHIYEEQHHKILRFKYEIRGEEMFISGKDESIAKATIMLAFSNIRELQKIEGCVEDPKKMGISSANYLYPIFLRLGVCSTEIEGSVNEM